MTDEYETEFKLLEGYESQLRKAVKAHVAKGWQPYGSPFEKGAHTYQAVVRYEPPEENH